MNGILQDGRARGSTGRGKSIRRRERRRFRRHAVERLENRVLLSCVNAAITQAQKDALVSGLGGLVTWAQNLDEHGLVGQVLPIIGQALGHSNDIGQVLLDRFVTPIIDDYFDDLTPTTNELVNFIQNLGGSFGNLTVSIDPGASGGLCDGTELAFTLGYHADKSLSAKPSLGLKGNELGITFDPSLNFTADFDFAFTFGLNLAALPSVGDAFFIRDASLSAHANANGMVSGGMNLGFFDATMNGTFNLNNAGLSITLNDIDGTVTLNQLINTPLSTLVTLTPSGSASASVNATANALGLMASGMISISTSSPFTPPEVMFDASLSEVKNFTNVNSAGIIGLLGQLAGHYLGLGQSSVLGTALHLAGNAALRNVLHLDEVINVELVDALIDDVSGLVSFDSTQSFVTAVEGILGAGSITPFYDQATDELSYTLTIDRNFSAMSQPFGVEFNLDPLVSLTSSSQVSASGAAMLNLKLGINLSGVSATLTGDADGPTNGQLVAGDAVFNLAAGLGATPIAVTLTKASTLDNSNLDDLVADLNAALATAGLGDAVTAGRNGNRLTLTMRSNIIADLTLTASKSNPAVTELHFVNGQHASDNLANHAYIENAGVSGNVSVSAPDIDASARLGFLKIDLIDGSGSANAAVDFQLKNPTTGTPGGRITFSEFVQALQGPIGNLVTGPNISGSVNINLPLKVTGDILGILPGNPNLVVTWTDITNPGTLSFNFNDSQPILNFENVNASTIINALLSLASYLASLNVSSSLLDQEIPLLNKSISEVLSFVEDFADKAAEYQANPAQALQDLEAFLEEAFNLSDPQLELTLQENNTVVRVDLDLTREFATSLPMNFALGAFGISGVGNLLDFQGSGNLAVAAGVNFGLDFGIDISQPTTPRPFIYDTTSADLSARVTGTNINFSAALGPLGLFVKNAVVNVDGDGNAGTTTDRAHLTLDINDTNADGKVYLSEISLSNASVTVTGQAHATVPLFFPLETTPLDPMTPNLELAVTDLGNIGGTTTLVAPNFAAAFQNFEFLSDLRVILTGVDFVLAQLELAIREQALGKRLPIVGEDLDQAADFINDLRTKVIQRLTARFNSQPNSPEIARKALFEAFGPGGLGILKDRNNDSQINLNDVGMTLSDLDAGGQADDKVEYDLQLGQNLTLLNTELDFDLGLPRLGLSVMGGVELQLGWEWDLKFGVQRDVGFYINTAQADELEVNLLARIPDLSARGDLFFLQLDVTDEDADSNPNNDGVDVDMDGVFPSSFGATLKLNLVDPIDPAANQLTFDDIINSSLSQIVQARIDGTADVNLNLMVSFQGDARFPSIGADFALDWNFANDSTFQGSVPTVAFNNVRLDVGEFVTDFAEEIVRKVRKLTEPLDEVVEFLTTPMPILSEFGINATPIQLAEVFGFIGPQTADFIEAAATFINIINNVPDVDQNLFVPLGAFNLQGVDPRQPSAVLTPNITQVVNPIAELNNIPAAAEERDFLDDLFDIGFSFPLIENPAAAFTLLLGAGSGSSLADGGGDVDLFTYDVPDIDFSLPFAYRFGPIFPPLPIFGVIRGSVGAKTDLKMGYDTHGLRKFRETDDTLDVFSGFFLFDRDDDGKEKLEASLTGSLQAGLEINIGFAAAGVTGGIFATLGVDLVDPDNDGKVHVDEFLENLDKNFLCTFDVKGMLTAGLSVYVDVGVPPANVIHKEKTIAEVTLIDFELTDEDCYPDRFSGNNSQGSATDLGVAPGLHVDWLSISGAGEGSASGAGDEDWLKFELLEPDSIDVDIRYTHSRGNLALAVYNEAGMLLGQSDTAEDRDLVRLTNLPAGFYYARVTGTAQNEYKFAVEPGPTSTTRVIYVNPSNANPEHPTSYYTHRPGKDINDGLDYTHPKATLQSVYDTYDIGPNDLIVFDTGSHGAPATLTVADQGANYTGTPAGSFISNLVLNDSDNNLFYRVGFGGSGIGLHIAGNGKNDAVNNVVRSSNISSIPTGIRIDSTRYNLIENNFSSGSGTTGIHITSGAAPVVRSNNIAGRQVGIYTASKVAQLYGNDIHDNATGITVDGGVLGPNNIPPVESPDDLTRNDIHDNDTGILIPPTSTGAVVRFNTVRDNTVAGIEARAENSTIVANLVTGNTIGIIGDDLVGPANWESNLFNVVRNNTTGMWANAGAEFRFNKVHNNTTGIRADGGLIHHSLVYRNSGRAFSVDAARNVQIISNTVFAPAGDGVHFKNFSRDVTLRNNIINVQGGYALRVDPDSEDYDSNYNNLFTTGSGKVAFQGKDFTDLYDWQTEAESDIHSIGRTSLAPTMDDPLFVNASIDDYHLQTGSTSIDTGDPTTPFSMEPAPNGGRINLGAYGNTPQASLSPSSRLQLTAPNFYVDLDRVRSYAITWRTFNVSGNLKIDLIRVVGTPATIALFASVPASAGSQNWTPSTFGIAGSTTDRYRVRLTSLSNPSIVEESLEPFAIVTVAAAQSFYVDDASNANDEFTATTVGSNRNTGTVSTQPKASLRGILLSYPLTASHTVNIDTGSYVHAIDNNLRGAASSAEPRIQTVSGATIRGPTLVTRVAQIDRANPHNGATTIHLIGSDNVKIRDLTLIGADNGLHASNDSDTLQATNLKISGHAHDGLLIEGNSDNATLTNLTVFNNARHGIFVDSLLSSLSGSQVYDNMAIGVALRNVGGATMQSSDVYNNMVGIDVINPGAAMATVGESTLSYLGNKVHNNTLDGVFASGNVLVGGNTVYSNGTKGIRLDDDADALRNIVRGNQTGISAFGSTSDITENRVYSHPLTGIEASFASTIVRNIVYSNDLYGIHTKNFSGLIDHNTVYSTGNASMNIQGPGRGGRVINNTVYEPCDDNMLPMEQTNIRFNWDWFVSLERFSQPIFSVPFYSNGSPDPTAGALNARSVTKSGVPAQSQSFWSEVQNPAGDLTQSNVAVGFNGYQTATSIGEFRLADDFTVPQGQTWTIDNIHVYGSETNFVGSSPLQAINLQIWNGRPGDPGSSVIFGDPFSNRLQFSRQTEIYRTGNTVVPPVSQPLTNRQIYEHTVFVGTSLTQGTYWLDWQYVSANFGAQHFSPSLTIDGARGRAGDNGRVLTVIGGNTQWVDAIDTGRPSSAPDVPQDFPFVLVGRVESQQQVFTQPSNWSGPTWGAARIDFAQPRGVNNPANTFDLGPGGDANALTNQPVPAGDTYRIPIEITDLSLNSVMSGFNASGIGPVFMQLSEQQPSTGLIEVTLDQFSQTIFGNVVLDVFVDFILPSQGTTLAHQVPVKLFNNFSGLGSQQSLQTVIQLFGQSFPQVQLYDPQNPSIGAWGQWSAFQTQVSAGQQIQAHQDAGDTCAEIGIWVNTQATKVLLRNNIVYVEGSELLPPPDNSHDIVVESDSTARWDSDFNLLTTRFGNIGRFGAAEAPDLMTWQDVTDDDRHSTDDDIDLIFVDPDGGDGMLGFAGVGLADGRDDNFHLRSPFGHVVIGANAPEEDLDGTSLPEFAPVVYDSMPFVANLSPAIDNGDPSYDYTLEPLTNPIGGGSNGKWINQGAYGNTPQASLSPVEFLYPVFPIGFEQLVPGRTVLLTWRTHDPVSFGVDIELLGAPGVAPLVLFTGTPDDGSELWTVPPGLPADDDYRIRVTRSDAAAAGRTRFPFSIGPDTIAPKITDTDSQIVHDAFTTNASTSSIRLYFSENMLGATTAANYELRGAGADGSFGTGDDILYSLGRVYTPATPGTGTVLPGTPARANVLLTILSGPLPQGLYRLTAFATAGTGLRDAASIALDGDENGTPGGNYVRTFTIDTTPPILADIAESGLPSDYRNTPLSSATFTFSEPVRDFGLSDLLLTRDGRYQLLTGGQTLTPSTDFMTWTLTGLNSLTAEEGFYSLSIVPSAEIRDLATNLLSSFSGITWTMDTTAPTADITNVTPNPRTGSVSSMTIVFGEPVNGFDISKLTLTRNGGANLLSGAQTLTTSDDITFTLNGLSGLTAMDGTYVLTVSAAGITDRATNALAANAFEAFEVLTTAPAATIVAVSPDPRNTAVSSITITMSQLVSGFDISDLSLTRNGGPNLLTGAQTLSTDDGVTYTLSNLSSLTALAGNYLLTLTAAGSGITNAAGTAILADATESWSVDLTAPTADIGDVSPDPRATGVASINITFSEPISGFDLSDLTFNRNGGPNLLTSAQTLTTSDNITFTLGNLLGFTFPQGNYLLSLSASGSGIIDAASNSLAGDASDSFVVTATTVPTTALDDSFYVRMLGLDTILIWHNASTNGPPTWSLDAATTTSLIFDTGDGNDSLTVDATLGSPIPAASGITYDGGSQTTADSLALIGGGLSGSYTPSATTPGSGSATIGSGTISFTGLEPVTASEFAGFSFITPNPADLITIDSPAAGSNRVSGTSGGVAFESLMFFEVGDFVLDSGTNDGGAGSDSVTIDSSGLVASGLSSFRYIGGTGSDTLTVNGGSFTFATDASLDTANLTLNVNTDGAGTATVVFDATQHLADLNIGAGGSATLSSGADNVLVTKALSIAGSGTLDLSDNGMIIDYDGPSPIAAIQALLTSGYNGGAWNGAGINSSAAATTPGRALGFAESSEIFSSFPATFLGQSVDSTAVLVRYTLYGDADLTGNVNLNDFNRLAANFGSTSGSWVKGDFTYNGIVNLDDFNRLAANFGQSVSAELPDEVEVLPAPPRESASAK